MRPLTTSVTALRFVTLSCEGHEIKDVLLAGIGNQVHVLRPGREQPVVRGCVFAHGERVHRFSAASENRVIVCGGRFAAVIQVLLEPGFLRGVVRVQTVKEFEDWVWSSTWISQSQFIIVACGHSVSWICHEANLQKLLSIETTEKELTWSTELYEEENSSQFYAVAGTSFGDLLVWKLLDACGLGELQGFPLIGAAERGHISKDQGLRSVHRLKGHEGPVVRVKLSFDTESLASASVDRTVRLWQRSKSVNCGVCGPRGCFVPKQTYYGHLARVWDVSFLSNQNVDLVSVAEDRTCRIWSNQSAEKEVAVYYGHDGRNVWCVDVLSDDKENTWVASGGEDGEVKIRCFPIAALGSDLENVAERSRETIASHECVTGSFRIPGNYPNPRKTGGAYNESARTIIIPEKGLLFMSTDFGRILSVRFTSSSDLTDDKTDTIEASWSELYRDLGGIAYTPSSLVLCKNFLCAGRTDGRVTILRVDEKLGSAVRAETALQLNAFLGRSEMVMGAFACEDSRTNGCHLFVANSSGDLYHWNFCEEASGDLSMQYYRTYRQKKPTKSALVTGVLYVASIEVVVVGDRGGRVLVYEDGSHEMDVSRNQGTESRIDSYPLCICRPHSDRVSSLHETGSTMVSCLENSGSVVAVDLLTGGFDGRMSRLRLSRRASTVELTSNNQSAPVSIEVLNLEKTIERVDTIGKLMFPRLHNGETIPENCRDSNGRRDSYNPAFERQCVLGFRSADVIVWDVQQRNELYRKNCGNWRRAHDIYLDLRCSAAESSGSRLTVESMTFAFWRSGCLYAVETRATIEKSDKSHTADDSKTVVDSKYVQSIGPGFHGQRANAVDRVGLSNVYLTASEDTTIRVVTLQKGMWKTCQTLSKHISGVNDLSITTLRSSVHVLFSAGGCDEIVVWISQAAAGPWKDVSTLQVENRLARKKASKERRPLHRVLCIKALDGDGCSCDKQCATGVAGRSDGSIIMVQTCKSMSRGYQRAGNEWDINVIWSQASIHDGAVLCMDAERSDAAGLRDVWIVASGDTKGSVCLWMCELDVECTKRKLHLVGKWKNVHDGGVNCVSVMIEEEEVLVLSGGDDEQVRLGTCALRRQQNTEHGARRAELESTWRSGLGFHTAAVTGVAFVQADLGLQFVSVGADQRIGCGLIRLVRGDGAKYLRTVETMQRMAGAQRTNVADVAALCASGCKNDKVELVVAGCGLEAVELK